MHPIRPALPAMAQNRSATVLDGEFVWMGRGVRPNEEEVGRAVEVLSAVPLAAAAGWSVRGHPWTSHPRRLRTAVVPPSGEWQIRWLRGVREVDSLAGPVLLRRRHLQEVVVDPDISGDPVKVVSHALRSTGFRLLLLNDE